MLVKLIESKYNILKFLGYFKDVTESIYMFKDFINCELILFIFLSLFKK